MNLDGKELEGKIGDVGGYSVDVDDKGKIKIDASVSKDLGHSKVSNTLSIETDIFKLAEAIAKKSESTWDDKAISGLKAILGIKDEVPTVVAVSSSDLKV